MRADLGHLGLRERAGLLEDRVGQADLADVVEHARHLDALHALGRKSQLGRDQAAVAAHGPRVVGRAGVAQVERLGERHQRGELDLVGAASASGAKIAEISGLKITQRLRPSALAA